MREKKKKALALYFLVDRSVSFYPSW